MRPVPSCAQTDSSGEKAFCSGFRNPTIAPRRHGSGFHHSRNARPGQLSAELAGRDTRDTRDLAASAQDEQILSREPDPVGTAVGIHERDERLTESVVPVRRKRVGEGLHRTGGGYVEIPDRLGRR